MDDLKGFSVEIIGSISIHKDGMDKISMDKLIADYAEYKYSHGKAFAIIRSTSAVTSLVSSSANIWIIFRSHKGLSTAQHRMLLGMCIFDIFFSLGLSPFNAAAPSDNDYYVWNARGNEATCTAQGFLIILGVIGGQFYNATLNLYYLAVVNYGKSDDVIRAKFEPFFHTLPIVLAITFSVALLAKDHYNDNGKGACFYPVHDPPHCKGFDVGEVRDGFHIPCGRGIQGANIASLSRMIMVFIPAIIMFLSLGAIYRGVRKQEKTIARYGVSTLRSNLQSVTAATNENQLSSSGQSRARAIWGRIRQFVCNDRSSQSGDNGNGNGARSMVRSNNNRSQSRAVMHKACAYTFAWSLSHGLHVVGYMMQLAGRSFPTGLYYFSALCGPLQGFFNLFIFMYPKVISAKKSKRCGGGSGSGGGENNKVTWCQAIYKAFLSRGSPSAGQKKYGPRGFNLRRNRHLRKKTRARSWQDKGQEEEEKREIEVPHATRSATTKTAYSSTYASNIRTSSIPISDTSNSVTIQFDNDKDTAKASHE